MSHDPFPRPSEESLHVLADAAWRIADTLDDYMDMTLAGMAATHEMQAREPEIAAALKPLMDRLQVIADRRAAR